VQSNQLCWELAQTLGGGAMTHAGMSRPFYGSFRRALDSDQVVSVSKRRLQGLDELE
jgi:hypothetical protein